VGKYLDIARKLDEKKVDSLGSHPEIIETITFEPVDNAGRLGFINHLTETERQYCLDLLEIMQSEKFKLDRETAEQKAEMIIYKYHQQLQIQQAVHDYNRYGFIKIFSTVLGEAVYLAKHKGVIKKVPDQTLPVFIEDDLRGMDAKKINPEWIKTILEFKILFGGSITK